MVRCNLQHVSGKDVSWLLWLLFIVTRDGAVVGLEVNLDEMVERRGRDLAWELRIDEPLHDQLLLAGVLNDTKLLFAQFKTAFELLYEMGEPMASFTEW